AVDAVEGVALWRASGGNPLYLRFYALGRTRSLERPLRDLEVAEWRALPAVAREVASFLAVAERPLTVEDLIAVIGAHGGPQPILTALDDARLLVEQGGRGASLVHEHLRETLLGELQVSPMRLRYYGGRLAERLVAER